MSGETQCMHCGKPVPGDGSAPLCQECRDGLIERIRVLRANSERVRPLAIDPTAASTQLDLPAFAAPPPGSPVYHGHPVLEDVEVDGFRLGKITDFEAEEDTAGDAFVVAPDGSRAGLVWEVAERRYFEAEYPFDGERWGVWSVGFTRPMHSRADARRNLAEIVPNLREQWFRWRRGEFEETHEESMPSGEIRAEYDRATARKDIDAAGEAALRLGVSLEDEGDVPGAIDAYARALATNSREAAARAAVNLGLLLDEQGDSNGAVEAYVQAIAMGMPAQSAWATNNLGVILQDRGDTEGGESAFRQAMTFGPVEPAGHAALNLARLLWQREDHSDADEMFRHAEASEIPEIVVAAMRERGRMWREVGDTAAAASVYRDGMKLRDPEAAATAALNLGMLLKVEGDRDGAIEAFRAAMKGGWVEAAAGGALQLGHMLLDGDDTRWSTLARCWSGLVTVTALRTFTAR
jgi:tetratricopeptide (TPR) repeat protein